MLDLLKRQAQWLLEVNDMKAAAEMYWAAKDYETAVQIIGDNVWLDMLIDKVRALDKAEKKCLSMAGAVFRKHGHHEYAKETYLKMDDIASLMALHVELNMWDDAFHLAKLRPEFAMDIYLPYAEWLAMKDRFDEAQDAFKKAGRPDQALRMLEHLTLNAVTENRYNDAGYYYWHLASEALKKIHAEDTPDHQTDLALRKRFMSYYHQAEMYYAYHSIYRYTDEPFTSLLPDALFQTSQFILNNTHTTDVPHGVSKVYTLFALAKQGKMLGAFKLARQAYSKLLSLKMPQGWKDQIDLACLTIRTKPYNDKEELLPVCYRCSTSNPLLNINGDYCTNCGHPFMRSFCSFETLPLVKFELDDIPDEEALQLIEAETDAEGGGGKRKGAKETFEGGVDRMTLGDDAPEEDVDGDEDDEFQRQLMNAPTDQDGHFPPIVISASGLRAMPSSEVFVRRLPDTRSKVQYYRSVIPDLPITLCNNCHHFFHEEDYEFHVLQQKTCPFCRILVEPAEAEPED
jgi:intraflagellar transport protein 122